MDRTHPRYSLGEGHGQRAPLTTGAGWGFAGGLAGTLVMDLLLIGALSAIQYPPLLCFSIVGDTMAQFFSVLGIGMAGGVPSGIAAHYVIGPLIGLLFGAALAMVPLLRGGKSMKIVMAAVLYVEILSQPILATTPLLLKMTAEETLSWFGSGFVMHLVFGVVLGVIVGGGMRLSPLVHPRRIGGAS